MVKKQNRIFERRLFIWLILAGFIVLFTPKSLTNKLQFAFIRIFNKPLGLCRTFAQSVNNQQSSAKVVEQHQYLKLRNHLANTMQWLRQEHQNVEKLSGLRNRSVWKGVNLVLADIITTFTDASRNELIINRGRDDGLAQGQFVFDDYSILGTITDLDSRTARVQLLTDQRSKVVVKIGRLDLQYIMQGNGDNSASIKLVSKKYKIRNGDIIYVQKKPGFLDVSMIAGTVVQCKVDDENPLLWKLTIEPVYEMKDIKDVTVIIMNSQKYNEVENDEAAA